MVSTFWHVRQEGKSGHVINEGSATELDAASSTADCAGETCRLSGRRATETSHVDALTFQKSGVVLTVLLDATCSINFIRCTT